MSGRASAVSDLLQDKRKPRNQIRPVLVAIRL